MARRFRGFLPVVIDVETGGFNAATDALLEIAAVLIEMDADGTLRRGATHSFHVQALRGRAARSGVAGRSPASTRFIRCARRCLRRTRCSASSARSATPCAHYNCRRAILVGHNAAFDLGFLNAAVTRADVKRNPFHPFSCFDTATLAGAALGQTVLAKAVTVAGLRGIRAARTPPSYDAERTAELFCLICNRCATASATRQRACALDGLEQCADRRQRTRRQMSRH